MPVFFTSKKEEQPEWLAQLQETKERWFTFLEKLESRMQELCEAAIPELKALSVISEDIYKSNYNKILSGINGQLEHIRKKACDAYDDKVISLYNAINSSISVLSPHHNLVMNFRNECSDRYHKQFDTQYQYWRSLINDTDDEDLEAKYKAILDEYAAIKDTFYCRQCGGNIVIDKVYFIATFISCQHCKTQNTFDPGTRARGLESLARQLAEQRTAHLLDAYSQENEKERMLYHKKREVYLDSIHEKDPSVLAKKQRLQEELESERQEAIKKAPALYEKYLRAMFDEWNKIVPDITEHNERFYQTLLNQFRARN